MLEVCGSVYNSLLCASAGKKTRQDYDPPTNRRRVAAEKFRLFAKRIIIVIPVE
jgi:hypothetical protein